MADRGTLSELALGVNCGLSEVMVRPSATLVTGATGHLGANLVRRLLHEGECVRVLLRPHHDTRAVDGLDVECAPGDIRDRASLDAAMEGCARVFHCAAR